MIQSTRSSTAERSLGFESLSRFGSQATKAQETGRARASAVANELTPDQQAQVAQLKLTDAKVRAHEQAHLSVGGDLVIGGPSFSYEAGPDRRLYAVSGEVSIDTTPGRTPEETIPKAQHIRATALAPAEPSSQDQSVAAQASQMEVEARLEMVLQQRARDSGQGSSQGYSSVVGENLQIGGLLDIFA